jgi:SAM-dependent methyltransferase
MLAEHEVMELDKLRGNLGLSSNWEGCPACGEAAAPTPLFSKNGCDILRCQRCGLGRTLARQFDPGKYYTEDYFVGGRDDGYLDYQASERVLGFEFSRTVEFIRGFRPNGRLLELGCAYGFFLQQARKHFEVVGIELADAPAAHAQRSGLRVICGSVDEATLRPLGSFDVVVMLDVLEHLPDPAGTLSLCARQLTPGGLIVITTGDFASLYARLARSHWRLMTPPQHLWFFTPASIRCLAAELSLEVCSIDHPWKIVPFGLILYQFGRMVSRRWSAASSAGIPVNLYDAMRIVLRKA